MRDILVVDALRYGIIGTGMMGMEHIANLRALSGVTVTAIADPNEHQRQLGADLAGDVAVFEGHRELLASGLCDAVVIAAPNHRHHEILMDAVDADIHILAEKPMCTSSKQCREVIAASQSSGRVRWVGLEYRYMPPIAALIERLDAAGSIKMVVIREHRFPFLEKVEGWNRLRANTGGTLVEKCCHFFHLMNLVAGARPVRVFASGAQDVNHLDETVAGQRSDIIDNALVVVDYANGVRGQLDLCMFAEGAPFEQQVVVTGDKGQIEALVPPGEADRRGVVQVNTRSEGVIERSELENTGVPHVGLHHGASYLEHVDFLDAIRNDRPATVTFEDGFWSVIVGEAGHRSIDEGRPVAVAELLG